MVEKTPELGLEPNDYFDAPLRRLVRAAYDVAEPDPRDRIELDIVATASLARLGIHLQFGKVVPQTLDLNWNLNRSLAGVDPVDVVQAAIEAGSLEQFAQDHLPDFPFYRRLRAALQRYRELESQGGWRAVPAGPTLRRGAQGDRVAALVQRLGVTGDLEAGHVDSRRFDADVEAGWFAFRSATAWMRTAPPGRARPTLNVSAQARVDQIRVNLERARWVFRDVGTDFVVVNIAGFELWVVRDREIVWETIAQVGTRFRQTPVFKSTMKYMVFNPTWTVPPTILAQDILPKVQADPSYLASKNMSVVDRNGDVVPASSIDWPAVTPSNFRHAIRQKPGFDNAHGRVKFIFPNEHFVFLHDTPSRHLFDRADRAFSSGCIRVQHPLRFAELLLDDADTWSRAHIDEILDSKQTRTVFLARPLPVLLLYWTVDEDPTTGELQFVPDVYGRDRRVLEALDAAPEFHPFDEAPSWMPQTSR